MLNSRKLALTLATIALASAGFSAQAGNWPNVQVRKPAAASQPKSDFEFVGGDTGWQLRTRKISEVPAPEAALKVARIESTAARDTSDFQAVDGDTVSQLRQHEYAFVNGKVDHASTCTQMARAATAVKGSGSAPASYALPGG